jgi:AcrR family transcriptional regulator
MPKIVDREKKRAEIAQKAVALFARKGFQATTIQDIADAAQLGKGTIYHYFRTKEEILLVISNEILHEMERSLGAALLRLDEPEDKLAALIQESLKITEELENLYIIYTELWLTSLRSNRYSDIVKLIKDLNDDLRKMVSRMIEDGKSKGIFVRDIDSDALAVYLVTSFDGVVFHYLLDKKSFDIKHVTKEFIRFLLRHASTAPDPERPDRRIRGVGKP